jgi:hypothetical protein
VRSVSVSVLGLALYSNLLLLLLLLTADSCERKRKCNAQAYNRPKKREGMIDRGAREGSRSSIHSPLPASRHYRQTRLRGLVVCIRGKGEVVTCRQMQVQVQTDPTVVCSGSAQRALAATTRE